MRSYFEEGDLESANTWYTRLRPLFDPGEDLARSCPAHILAQIALVEERYDAPELVDFPVPGRWESIASARTKALRWRCGPERAAARAAAEHGALLGQFKGLFDRAKRTGNQDFLHTPCSNHCQRVAITSTP